jgi:3-methyladenine DNA glycosylase AlkD
MERWVSTFENWEICDSFSIGLFTKSTFADQKIGEWTKRKPEFEKRAGFTIIAAYCMADKQANNAVFEQRECDDDRLYVKKAVNWALRNIGKRNIDLNKKTILVAKAILKSKSITAQWIAKYALKEIQNENVRMSDYPRATYRKK